MTDQRPPFHTISASDVYTELRGMREDLTKAMTRMEAQMKTTDDNTARIKALEVKVYGIAAGLLAGIVALLSGVFGA